MTRDEISGFAARYAAAWCSQDPESVASFFSECGVLKVNDAPPAVGRTAIAEIARGFMRDFPDLLVTNDNVVMTADGTEFHWTLTGTHACPGGPGNRVQISGYELWQFGSDGFISESKGCFDGAEYERQLKHGAGGSLLI